MSRSALMLSRTFISWLSALLLSVVPLVAGLVGDYDESRWSLKSYGGDGTVDWLGDTILFDSGYTGDGNVAQADLVIRATRSGTFYFSWTFYGGTSTGYRLARLRNETSVALATRRDYAEGTEAFTASAGDLIGFRIGAPLDEFPAMAEIFEFFAPGQEPAIHMHRPDVLGVGRGDGNEPPLPVVEREHPAGRRHWGISHIAQPYHRPLRRISGRDLQSLRGHHQCTARFERRRPTRDYRSTRLPIPLLR